MDGRWRTTASSWWLVDAVETSVLATTQTTFLSSGCVLFTLLFFPAVWMRRRPSPVKNGFPLAGRKGIGVVPPPPPSRRPCVTEPGSLLVDPPLCCAISYG